jgi:hypothetical protein
MSESKALLLTFTTFGIVIVVAYVGLAILDATPETLTAVFLVIAGLGAHAISRVVMHYTPPEERGRRR